MTRAYIASGVGFTAILRTTVSTGMVSPISSTLRHETDDAHTERSLAVVPSYVCMTLSHGARAELRRRGAIVFIGEPLSCRRSICVWREGGRKFVGKD